jgi:hypothetical protein
MKRFLTLAVATVLILGLAVATYAFEISTSGLIRNRTALYVNSKSGNLQGGPDGGLDDTVSDMDMRMRIRWAISANEYLTGHVRLEANGDWGGSTGVARLGTDEPDALVVQHAFVSFKVPGLEDYGATLDVGAQSFFLSRWNFDGDAAGVTADFKIEPASIRLQWIKEEENSDFRSDDWDNYGAIIRVPFGDIKPAVWGYYSKIGKGATAVSLGGANASSALYWLGFTVDGKIGPVSFLGDLVYNGGDLDYDVPVGTVDKDEFGGYLLYAKGSMPVGDMYEVGAEFFYATGDDKTDAATGELDGYRYPTKNPSHASLLVFTENNVNGGMGITGGLGSGYWSAMGYASAKPLDWLKVTGYVAYIGDTTEDGDTYGTALNGALAPEDNDDIGIELGAIANIQIYKELVLNIGAGMLLPGDALEQRVAGSNEEPDNPWAITSNLQMNF